MSDGLPAAFWGLFASLLSILVAYIVWMIVVERGSDPVEPPPPSDDNA